MPQLASYLSFDGNCAEAMRFYEKTLGGTLVAMIRNRDTPMADQIPSGSEDRIMHACLELPGGAQLMAGDAMCNDQPFQPMRGFMLAITYDRVEQAQRVFDALAPGGQVQMPMAPTFWAERFGMLTDRYGTPWAINGGPIAASGASNA